MRSAKSSPSPATATRRASQAYSVWIAKAGAPEQFIKIADARVISQGGATRLRVPVNESDVVAVRLDFADGPARLQCLSGNLPRGPLRSELAINHF